MVEDMTTPALNFRNFTVPNRNSESYILNIVEDLNLLRGGSKSQDSLVTTVSDILSQVRRHGDSALIKLGNKLDRTNFSQPNDFFVQRKEIQEAYSRVESNELKAINNARRQIAFVARKQRDRFGERKYKSPIGFTIVEKYSALSRVGGYVPGGLASYPSTVLMICVTAAEAGVKDIVLATPAKNGQVNPTILVTADVCGVKEIIKIGGAQAIAALAYGTESIRKVDIIVGPGNEFVTEAKRQVASEGVVSIDTLAGPTELLVLADSTADPRLVYEDLISQAEHGNRTLCGVISDSRKLIDNVNQLANFDSRNSNRERMKEISQSILFTVKVNSIVKDGGFFAQKLAPEHLELVVSKSNERLLQSTFNKSGLVLLGDYTPCSSTDYIVGTNHILPTNGQAARHSGLSVENFLKRVVIVRGTENALKNSLEDLSVLAQMESLPNHAKSAKIRFDPSERDFRR